MAAASNSELQSMLLAANDYGLCKGINEWSDYNQWFYGCRGRESEVFNRGFKDE